MTEQEKITLKKEYGEFICTLSQKKIAIYGTGDYSEYILNNFNKYIVGVVDDLYKDGLFHGYPVYRTDEVADKADIIVIMANIKRLPIIYSRLYSIAQNIEIRLYNGLTVNEETVYEIIGKNEYWTKSYNELKKKIDCHDVISFDIYDTLVTRTVMKPDDILKILARKNDGIDEDIIALRKMAQRNADSKHISANFDEIYDEYGKISKLSVNEIERIKTDELYIETDRTVTRKKMVEALNYAKDKGKKVLLISDMYFGKKYMKKILESMAIHGYDGLYVSCDERAWKWPDGDLYKRVAVKENISGCKWLHVGNDSGADGLAAQMKGIDSYIVWSTGDMLVNSEYVKLLEEYGTPEKKDKLGKLMAELFNDPFALNERKGRIYG